MASQQSVIELEEQIEDDTKQTTSTTAVNNDAANMNIEKTENAQLPAQDRKIVCGKVLPVSEDYFNILWMSACFLLIVLSFVATQVFLYISAKYPDKATLCRTYRVNSMQTLDILAWQ